MRRALIVLLLLGSTAFAGDREDCANNNRDACARIGKLKRLGALKADGTRDLDVLVKKCGAALDAVKSPDDYRNVAGTCGMLFTPKMAKNWEVLQPLNAGDRGVVLLDGYGEIYCPTLTTKVTGCDGKKPGRYERDQTAAIRTALAALNAAALAQDIGADKASPLVPKFDAAWAKLF